MGGVVVSYLCSIGAYHVEAHTGTLETFDVASSGFVVHAVKDRETQPHCLPTTLGDSNGPICAKESELTQKDRADDVR